MLTELIIRKLPVTMLKPAKYNPRKDLKPGDPAYEKIKRSLHDFGYVDPVIWNEVTGNIVGGHQRYKVLTAEGATEIDCVVVHIRNATRYLTGEAAGAAVVPVTNTKTMNSYDDSITFSGNEFSIRSEQDIRDLAREIAVLTKRQQAGKE